jgi:DNA invertase Pin-like site-specific DNA recombinase
LRPAYEQLLTDVAARRIDAVLVWRLDRLVRSPGEFERFWSACRTAGVEILSATEPVGASDPVSLAIVRLLVTFAGLESDVKGIRIRARNRELAEQGRAGRGGTRHFGFTKGYTAIIEEEAAHIRQACDRILAGESPQAIAKDWQARGVPSVRGGQWRTAVVITMLSSHALAGDRTYYGEVVARDAWPAIIDRETSAEVRNRLAGQRGRAKRAPGARGVLRGNVRCGRCGGPMYVTRTLDRHANYSCGGPHGCGRVAIDQESLDDWLTELVLYRLEARRSKRGRLIWDRTDTDARIRTLNQESARIRELNRRYFVTGDISYPEWVRARDDLTQDTGQRLVREQALRPPRGLPPSVPPWKVRSVWTELPIAVRREVIGIELNHVVVHPARGHGAWDPTRVDPFWILPDPPPSKNYPVPRPSRRPAAAIRRDKAAAARRRDHGGPFGLHDAALVSGVRIKSITLLRESGDLPAEFVRGRYLYRLEDLDRAFPPEDFNSFTISRDEALAILNTTRYRLHRFIAEGTLPHRQRGERARLWFRRADLEHVLQDDELRAYLHDRRTTGRWATQEPTS